MTDDILTDEMKEKVIDMIYRTDKRFTRKEVKDALYYLYQLEKRYKTDTQMFVDLILNMSVRISELEDEIAELEELYDQQANTADFQRTIGTFIP